MAHIGEDGILVADPGDTVKVIVQLRGGTYYGPFTTPTGKPDGVVVHATGNLIPYGANTASTDGTTGMAKRVANGSARYYAHVYLSRDGVAYQVAPFNVAAIHTEGSYQGRESNKHLAGIEVTNLAYTSKSGVFPSSEPLKIDPTRDDMELGPDGKLWQRPTAIQMAALGDVLFALKAYGGMADDQLVLQHGVIGSGGHYDKSPLLDAEHVLPFVVRAGFPKPLTPTLAVPIAATLAVASILAASAATYLYLTGDKAKILRWQPSRS